MKLENWCEYYSFPENLVIKSRFWWFWWHHNPWQWHVAQPQGWLPFKIWDTYTSHKVVLVTQTWPNCCRNMHLATQLIEDAELEWEKQVLDQEDLLLGHLHLIGCPDAVSTWWRAWLDKLQSCHRAAGAEAKPFLLAIWIINWLLNIVFPEILGLKKNYLEAYSFQRVFGELVDFHIWVKDFSLLFW